MERLSAVMLADAGQRPGMTRAAEMLRQPETLATSQAVEGPPAFSNLLSEALQTVHEAQQGARVVQQAYQQGSPEVGLEETMIAMNQASLSFQMLAQARNRVVAAYNEIMNMQV